MLTGQTLDEKLGIQDSEQKRDLPNTIFQTLEDTEELFIQYTGLLIRNAAEMKFLIKDLIDDKRAASFAPDGKEYFVCEYFIDRIYLAKPYRTYIFLQNLLLITFCL